jgi:hypothetical protein
VDEDRISAKTIAPPPNTARIIRNGCHRDRFRVSGVSLTATGISSSVDSDRLTGSPGKSGVFKTPLLSVLLILSFGLSSMALNKHFGIAKTLDIP